MFMEHNSKELFGITTKSQRTQAQAAGSAPPGYVLVKEGQPKQVYAEVEKFGGRILKTRLAHQDETKLEAALAAAKKEGRF